MAFFLPVPNGNPWPKSWTIQPPVLGNNVSHPKPSKFQQTLKLAYSRDIRSFRKHYNKNISKVVCSGVALPRIMASRCKNVKTLELYENSQIKSQVLNLKCLKLGYFSQKKKPMKLVQRLVRHNKGLNEIWIDRYETMKIIASNLKCPRQLSSFSLGLCNSPKEEMIKGMRFLIRHKKLKQIALCSTEPQQQQNRAIDREAEAFMKLLTFLFKKISLKVINVDVMDPVIVEKANLLNNSLLTMLHKESLDSFDLRLSLASMPILGGTVHSILQQLDYFALSINGVPFQKTSFSTEERLERQKISQRRLMIDFKGLTELDLNPILFNISNNLKVLDLSFRNDDCSVMCNWSDTFSRLKSLKSLFINFSNCSSTLANTLSKFSACIQSLPSLMSTAINFENIDFTPEIYQAIDTFYVAIQHIPEHNFGLEAGVTKEIQLDTICNSLKHLQNLKVLNFMLRLRAINSIECVGSLIRSFETIEKLNLHIRLEMHETMAFDLPLAKLSKLNHLRVELLFKPSSEFIDQLNPNIGRLASLKHLELTILSYAKIKYTLFKNLLTRLNALKDLKELEMSVNVEDENVNDTLTEKNLKIKKELQTLLHKHPSLMKIMFHHFVSYICCTK